MFGRCTFCDYDGVTKITSEEDILGHTYGVESSSKLIRRGVY